MAGSIDHVLQPDGTYKWEVVEPKTEAQKTAEASPSPATLVPGELGISESTPEKGVLKGKTTKKKVVKKKTDSPLSE